MSTTAQAPQSDAPIKPRIIKRYSNRKLYDTERSRYVTLEEISKMIKAGDEVTIIDNESKEDLTSVTLTQIIYEEEKRESRMPLGMLRHLIQTGGTTLQEFFDKSVKAPVETMRDSAQKSVEKGVEELRQSAVQFREAATRSVSEFTESARRVFSREERKAQEFQSAVIQLFDALEERVSARIEDVRHTYQRVAVEASKDENAPTVKDAHSSIMTESHVSAIRDRIRELEALVQELEATTRTVARSPSGPGEPPPANSDEIAS